MIDFKALAAPFDPDAVSWRIGSMKKDKTAGMALAYIDARVVMDRLDDVCGPGGWQCRYSHTATKTVCDIAIKCGEEWLWKADGAGDSDIEAEKGALSDAFKRAAVRWGIGRYLYELPSPWVEVDEWKRIKQAEYKKLEQILRQHTRAILDPAPKAPGTTKPGDFAGEAIKDGLTTDTRSVGAINGAANAKKWADVAIQALNFAQTVDDLNGWTADKKNAAYMIRLEGNYPDQHQRVQDALDNARLSLRDRAA
ncbi:MAG: Rad52/Rad22 family DNA repair protein [Elstera sp.]